MDGWLNLHKPCGITSAKAVAVVKKYFRGKKIGHAGTLDPLASGVLPLAIGEATKTIQFGMDSNKEYEFTVKWGQTTDTLDCEGKITDQCDIYPSKAQIIAVLPEFIGKIDQAPPQYSAIKINGKRAYALARQGIEVAMPSRKVMIHALDLIGCEKTTEDSDEQFLATATFRVSCGKGTYIRSLCRDIAIALGTVAHVTILTRTKVGKFALQHAILLEDIEKAVYKDAPSGVLLPVDTVLDDIQALEFTPEHVTRIRQGQKIPIEECSGSGSLLNGIFIAKNKGIPVAICESGVGLIKPIRIFNL